MGRPTISVLCPTAHQGPLVGHSLSLLRDAVDEIVVAADSRVGATDLAYYADVADLLLRYEHAGANRHWPWLVAQASGDWILMLDGDELPSGGLAAALPELVADRRVRQYSLPLHWVWSTAETRLAEEPWSSNRVIRLVRNDPGLAFAARKHALADAGPPIHYVDELPIYHLDLLLPDQARREAKVERYDTELFGLLTPEGLPFNRAFYLPEAREPSPATTPVPAADAERIAYALDAPRDGSREIEPASVPLSDREAVTWYAPRTSLPEDAYRARVELARALPRFTARRDGHLVWVEVTNEGTARWPGGERHHPLIRVGMAWQPVGGGPRHDAGRAMLPHRLDPGGRALLPIFLSGPPEPGPTELVIDFVHEHVRWFDQPLTARVEAGPSVEARIAALSERHGPLIPPAAAMEERRAIGIRDCLLRQDPPDVAPADPAIAELVTTLSLGPWAVDAWTIDCLVERVRTEQPATIAEFGSGTSTVVLAALLAERHSDGPRLLSFEQDPAWAEHTRAALDERGLGGIARVIQLDIGEGEGEGDPPGFLMTAEATELLRTLAPRLILVDGPTLDSGASRLGALDLIAPHLQDDATVLLDDALRDAELAVAAAWERRDDVVLHGIRTTPRGLLEATLRAAAGLRPTERMGETGFEPV